MLADALWLNRLAELQQRCDRRQQITHTDFLPTETAAETAAYLARNAWVPWVFSGGFPGAERQALFFLPDWQPPELFDPGTVLTALRIIPSDPAGLTHRDYLGSLMALGVKREKTGDFLLLPELAQLVLMPSLIPYLTSNLTRVGRAAATVEEIPLTALIQPERRTETFTRTVMSLRCDSVIAAAFGLSRGGAAEAIARGLVTVDHRLEEKPDRLLPERCLVVVRGRGRAEVATEYQRSRKGRILITVTREE